MATCIRCEADDGNTAGYKNQNSLSDVINLKASKHGSLRIVTDSESNNLVTSCNQYNFAEKSIDYTNYGNEHRANMDL
jgi:hypothetical protein